MQGQTKYHYIVNLIPPGGGGRYSSSGKRGSAVDWITLSIEAVGLAILCIWIVIPINEFKEILAKLRPQKNHREGRDAE